MIVFTIRNPQTCAVRVKELLKDGAKRTQPIFDQANHVWCFMYCIKGCK